MGNRAVITTRQKQIGLYLHWNGGLDSIRGFLCFCRAHKYRPPEYDCYGWGYLQTVIGCFFGNGMSTGIDIYEKTDTNNHDNGVYVIKEWFIVGRLFATHSEQEEHDLQGMVNEINSRMPEHMQLKQEDLDKAVYEYQQMLNKGAEKWDLT